MFQIDSFVVVMFTKLSGFIPVYSFNLLKVFMRDYLFMCHSQSYLWNILLLENLIIQAIDCSFWFMEWFKNPRCVWIYSKWNKNFEPGFFQCSDFCSTILCKLAHFLLWNMCIIKPNIIRLFFSEWSTVFVPCWNLLLLKKQPKLYKNLYFKR